MTDMGRPRGGGSKDLPPYLYYRKDRGWFVDHPAFGRASLRTHDRDQAVTVYWQLIAELKPEIEKFEQQKLVDRLSKPKQTAASYAKYYRLNILPKIVKKDGKPVSERTRSDYERMLRRDIEQSPLFQIGLSDADITVCRRYLAAWLDNPVTYNHQKAVLSRVFKHAIDEGLILSNPVREIDRRPTRRREVYIEDDHYSQIVGNLDDWQARACDVIYLISHRPGDVLGIREPDIEFEGDTLTIRFTASKNGQAMEIVDDGDLAAAVRWFRQWKAGQGILSEHLICYPKTMRRHLIGKPLTVDYLSRRFSEALVEAGFPIGTYVLRDLRKKGLTDEARATGSPTNKGGHLTEQMRREYVVGGLPVRYRNTLRVLKKG